GKKSATFFWPGSDVPIGGQYPTYWYPYNSSVPYEDRVQQVREICVQVLDWVTLPADERPAWITLYFDEPDHTGHAEGPDSQGINDQLVRMDGLIGQLVTGLENAELLNCVNLIIVADHGMAGGGLGWVIKLSDYISDLDDTAYTYTGAFTRLDPKNDSDEVKYDMMRKLACQRTDMRTYEKSGLPKRFHFSNNRRIEDIVLDLDDGRYGSVSSSYYNNGNHGYDNYFPAMNALFVARGPAFKSGLELAPFQNIQLYNLMCHLTGVLPAENNGTLGALNAMLNTPGPIIPLPEVRTRLKPSQQGRLGRTAASRLVPERDGIARQDWLSLLNMTSEEQARLESKHAPWGLPRVLNQTDGLTLLHQPDFITAYSSSLKMPVWSSFSLFGAPTGTPAFNWTSDVRLNADQSVTCADYDSLTNVTMAPLFFPGFSSDSSQSKIPYMVSNAVPSTEQQQRHWQDLMSHLIARWLGSGSLNVIVGPVFDRNADSHADVFNSTETFPQLPTVLFAIVTRCSIGGNITACEPQNLESRAFLYPTVQPVENCLESSEYALEFSSTVRDVRIITGLAFYPDLSFDDRVRLETVVHQSLW
ncbi:hypothetical protein HAZT_HAZT005420, partial [Hyalella azteca]